MTPYPALPGKLERRPLRGGGFRIPARRPLRLENMLTDSGAAGETRNTSTRWSIALRKASTSAEQQRADEKAR